MIVVPSVLIAWVMSIGIHDKKRGRYEQGNSNISRFDM